MAGIRAEGRRRVVLDRVRPEVDGGRFPIKRVVGEWIEVEADAFADGHDRIRCELLYRHGGARQWSSVEMTHQVNDTWLARFQVHDLGPYVYTVRAWVDPFETWRQTLAKRAEAGQDVSVDRIVGADLLR